MGSAEGIRFHLKATHGLDDEIIEGMISLQREEYGVVSRMDAIARMHGAIHHANDVVAKLRDVLDEDIPCTRCTTGVAVVILTTDKLCRTCALTTGNANGQLPGMQAAKDGDA